MFNVFEVNAITSSVHKMVMHILKYLVANVAMFFKFVWDKVSKNWPSRISGIQPVKKITGSIFEQFVSYDHFADTKVCRFNKNGVRINVLVSST